MLNSAKFIRKLDADLNYQTWNNIDTFALDHVFLRVGYPAHEGLSKCNYAANVRKAPMMWTYVDHVQGDFEPTPIKFTVTGNSGGKGYSVDGNVIIREANTSIIYQVKNFWNGEAGVVNLEDLTQIWGPTEGASLIGSGPGFIFSDRSVLSKTL